MHISHTIKINYKDQELDLIISKEYNSLNQCTYFSHLETQKEEFLFVLEKTLDVNKC